MRGTPAKKTPPRNQSPQGTPQQAPKGPEPNISDFTTPAKAGHPVGVAYLTTPLPARSPAHLAEARVTDTIAAATANASAAASAGPKPSFCSRCCFGDSAVKKAQRDAAIQVQAIHRGRLARRQQQSGVIPAAEPAAAPAAEPVAAPAAEPVAAPDAKPIPATLDAAEVTNVEQHKFALCRCLRRPTETEEMEESAAVIRLQAIQRGRLARKGWEPEDTNVPEEAESAPLAESASPAPGIFMRCFQPTTKSDKTETEAEVGRSRSEAAIRVQAIQRGKLARKGWEPPVQTPSKLTLLLSAKLAELKVLIHKCFNGGMTVEEKRAKAEAAFRVQAIQRGKQSRANERVKADAAARVQAIQRGRRARANDHSA